MTQSDKTDDQRMRPIDWFAIMIYATEILIDEGRGHNARGCTHDVVDYSYSRAGLFERRRIQNLSPPPKDPQ